MAYTHDYRAHWGQHKCNENYYTDLFEKEAASYLEGTEPNDVGGVILYMKGDHEVAFFDYEMLVGSIYEITRKYSFETEMSQE